MLNLKTTTAFEKGLRKSKKRGKDFSKQEIIIDILQKQEAIPYKYKDHKLIGDYLGCRDLHIESDWVLIYKIKDDALILQHIGSYSDIFKKC